MKRLLTVLLILFSSVLFSQNFLEVANSNAIKIYGIDDILINGSIYSPKHPAAYGDPFLVENEFFSGNLNLKGREYKNILLKLDIDQQKLILKGFVDSVNFEILVLNYNYVKSFDIHNRHFVNITNYLQTTSHNGYYELIYKGDFVFVRRYYKEFLAIYSHKYPHGKYSETKTEKFIIKNNIEYRIKNKKSIYSLFPEKKIEIRKFIKENKIKLRKASNSSLNLLMQYLDEISD